MCAEAVPWRCHRSLIADALTVCRIEVNDIISISMKCSQVHSLTSFAKVLDSCIVYPLDKANRIRPSHAGPKYRITI